METPDTEVDEEQIEEQIEEEEPLDEGQADDAPDEDACGHGDVEPPEEPTE